MLRGSLMSKSFVFVLLLAIGGLCGLALLTRDLAALFPWHGLAALPRNGCALLLRVVEAVLLRHIVALLVPNHIARLCWHILALLSLHLSRNNSALLGGNVAADWTRAGGALLLGNRLTGLAGDGLTLLLADIGAPH